MRRHLVALGLIGLCLGTGSSAFGQGMGGGGQIGSGQSIGTGGNFGGGGFSGGNQGGNSGGSFSGGSNQGSSFSGGQSGNNNRTGRGGTSGTVVVPAAANPFGGTYYDPLSRGLVGGSTTGGTGSTKGSFGKPLYATNSTGNATTSTNSSSNQNNNASFNTLNVRRTPAYTTTLASDIPFRVPMPVGKLQAQLHESIQNSSVLKDRGDIKVEVQDQVVVLSGQVANERQRKLVEGMIRLSPGVREVRNELVAREKAPAPPEEE